MPNLACVAMALEFKVRAACVNSLRLILVLFRLLVLIFAVSRFRG